MNEAQNRSKAERERFIAVSALADAAQGRSTAPVLELAFAALGSEPTRREIMLVARAIRASGDERALALFPADDVHFDHVGPVQSLPSGRAWTGSSRLTCTRR